MTHSNSLAHHKAIVALRVACGLLFLPHAWVKWVPPQPAAGFFQTVGFPEPFLFMVLVGLLEVLACAGLVFGVMTRWAAWLGALVTVGAAGSVLKVGAGKSMWFWNMGGVEFPVLWAIVCVSLALIYHQEQDIPASMAFDRKLSA
jgi:putative oxidoreductase